MKTNIDLEPPHIPIQVQMALEETGVFYSVMSAQQQYLAETDKTPGKLMVKFSEILGALHLNRAGEVRSRPMALALHTIYRGLQRYLDAEENYRNSDHS